VQYGIGGPLPFPAPASGLHAGDDRGSVVIAPVGQFIEIESVLLQSFPMVRCFWACRVWLKSSMVLRVRKAGLKKARR